METGAMSSSMYIPRIKSGVEGTAPGAGVLEPTAGIYGDWVWAIEKTQLSSRIYVIEIYNAYDSQCRRNRMFLY